jgi:hypothetical protein
VEAKIRYLLKIDFAANEQFFATLLHFMEAKVGF